MRQFAIDCSAIETPEQFWEAYLAATCPSSAAMFGRNLDAFNDALAGGPGFPGECEISLLNSSSLDPIRDGSFVQALRQIAGNQDNVAVTVNFR